VILSGVRTPIGRYGGALSGVRPDDLAALVVREAIDRAGVPAEEIEDVYLGCANQAGEDNRNVARMAVLLAGLPEQVAGVTVKRLCASGLSAIGGRPRPRPAVSTTSSLHSTGSGGTSIRGGTRAPRSSRR
jgi:acetyl-CoA acetyltransferase